MKTLSLILVSIFFLATGSTAQNDRTIELLKNDLILKNLNEHLPEGWVMEINDTELLVYRIDKIVTLDLDCSTLSQDSLDNIERTETAYISFRYEEKWDSDKLFWIRELNDSLNLRLALLPQEYGIAHLYDEEKSTRLHKVYTGTTDADIEKVKNFNARRAEIQSYITPFPNFNTTTLSLRLIRQTGLQFPGQCVIPYNAYKESMHVYVLFLEYCENPLIK
jgi:hypothetical protein